MDFMISDLQWCVFFLWLVQNATTEIITMASKSPEEEAQVKDEARDKGKK